MGAGLASPLAFWLGGAGGFTAVDGGDDTSAADDAFLLASGCYFSIVAEADALAVYLPVPRFKAATSAAKAAALMGGTNDIDFAGPYQGRKYDLWTPQVRQFPRIPYESAAAVVMAQFSSLGAWLGSGFAGVQIWDWDRVNNVAIVPANVKLANLYQAEAILAGKLYRELEEQALGVVSESAGSLSVNYRDPAALAAVLGNSLHGLCRQAERIMAPYRLKSGRLL